MNTGSTTTPAFDTDDTAVSGNGRQADPSTGDAAPKPPNQQPETSSDTLEQLNDRMIHLERQLEQMESDSVATIRDVEQRLQEIRHRYETLANNIPLGLYRRTPGPEGKLITVNPALVRMFGYDSEESLYQTPVRTLYSDPTECASFSSRLYEEGEIIREHLKMKRKDGSPIWVSVTAAVICDDDGEVLFFDGIMEDITAMRQAEQDAMRQQQQLLQADKMISLGILVSGVAHEINNPNQFIVSHLAPLRRIVEDALPILDRYYEDVGDFKIGGRKYSDTRSRIPDMFSHIQEGTDRIRRIVTELRDYAREQPAEHREPVDINRVIRSALSLLKTLIRNSTRAFYVTYGKQLPLFSGDYHRIEQVLINLIQNACQSFDPSSPGEISIVSYHDLDEKMLVVQLNDTGCGIDPGDLRHIRDPFFTTKRTQGGTGLGLSISDTIIRRHAGRLEFVSEKGEGTTVRMMLPVTPPQESMPSIRTEES